MVPLFKVNLKILKFLDLPPVSDIFSRRPASLSDYRCIVVKKRAQPVQCEFIISNVMFHFSSFQTILPVNLQHFHRKRLLSLKLT